MIIRDRLGNETESNPSGSQKFLYRNVFGRFLLKCFLIRPWFTKFMGWFLSRKISKKRIPKFIEEGHINVDDYIVDDVKSYNDFFIRKIKEGRRIIDNEPSHFIAPCDSELRVFKINDDSIFEIKDSYYRVADLIKNDELAKEFLGGWCFIFRLSTSDYHRYSYPDSGKKNENIHIKGVFHTVNPIALERYNFYKTNSREYTVLDTDNFGKLIMCEVGAMMVGKIKNHHQEYTYTRGEEKGYFEFGGSTIVVLTKDILTVDEDILRNTSEGVETKVSLGERIAILKDKI
ncbi:MAG: phosphatidylserine decarboxylase [Acholeplasmatales bacterium]|nr:phosphatidylserine decarboxylase [Acholeplasmatales bacterium]